MRRGREDEGYGEGVWGGGKGVAFRRGIVAEPSEVVTPDK